MSAAEDMPIEYTHKGWFGICPVFIALPDEGVVMTERHWSFAPLMWLSVKIYDSLFILATLVNPHYEPELPIMITGEIVRKDC